MILKKAEPQNIDQVKEVTDLLHLDIPSFVWNDESFIKKQVENGEYFLMEEGGVVAGVMSLRERKNGMHIETLVIRKEFQGKGYGSKFIEFAKDYAKEHQIKKLYAYSFADYNISDFYTKKGFLLMDYVGFYKHYKYHCFEMNLS